MSNLPFGKSHIVKGLDAVANAFASTVYSDVVNVKDWHVFTAIVHKGVGTTGTSKIQVEACDNANGDNPVAVPFSYQKMTGADDVPTDVVTVSAADGFTTTAGSSQLYRLARETAGLPAGKTWMRVKATEVADADVLGGIIIELMNPRYGSQVPATVIA